MNRHAFTNRLKALRFIDRADLRDLTDNQWQAFRADPTGYLITQGDDVAAKIWAAVERGGKPDPLVAFVAQVARMTTDAEIDGDMSGDDAVTTLSGLIEEARALCDDGDKA